MAAKLHSHTRIRAGGGKWVGTGESDIANSWMSTTLAERAPLAKLEMKGTRSVTQKKTNRISFLIRF